MSVESVSVGATGTSYSNGMSWQQGWVRRAARDHCLGSEYVQTKWGDVGIPITYYFIKPSQLATDC